MTYTTDQAIALAREYGYGGQQITPEELTALCNKVRDQALLEAAEACGVERYFMARALLTRMAGVE